MNAVMTRHVVSILWLLMVLACEAAEIVSWKVPLSCYVWGVEAEKKVRLKSAPQPLPFFKDGDELWDLKGIPATEDQAATDPLPPQDIRLKTDPPLDWVVWNARSGRLVVKGDWNAIWQLHYQLRIDQLPRQCRITTEVFEVPVDGAPLTEKAVPAAFLSGVSRPGQEFEAVRQQEGKLIHVKVAADIGDQFRFIDLKLELSCALPGQPGISLKTAFTCQPGKPLWVARDFDGNKGLDLRVSAAIELIDGTPANEIFLIQQGDVATPLVVERSELKRHRIGDKDWLAVQWLDPLYLSDSIMPELSGRDPDPFAEAPPKNKSERPVAAAVPVPEVLKPWFNRPVLDLREYVKNGGVVSADFTGFAGYDRLAQRVFLFSNDVSELDKFEQLFSGGCNLSPRLVVVTMDGNGQTRLVTRSGVKSRLIRESGDQKIIRSLHLEPVIGGTGDLIEVGFEAVDNTKATPGELLKSAVLLRSGEPLAVLVGSAPDGKESSLRIKAETQGVSE